MHQGKTQRNHRREGSTGSHSQEMMAAKEHELDLHNADWPMFMSADDQQKMLEGKIMRAARYIAALQHCPVAQRRNFDVRSQHTESTGQSTDV